jgi:hypothetical protein
VNKGLPINCSFKIVSERRDEFDEVNDRQPLALIEGLCKFSYAVHVCKNGFATFFEVTQFELVPRR